MKERGMREEKRKREGSRFWNYSVSNITQKTLGISFGTGIQTASGSFELRSRNTAETLVEFCSIRDGLSTCNALSYLDACELINLIPLN